MQNSPHHPEVLSSVQAGRAIAALLVIFYHASLYIFALDKYWGFDPAYHFFDFSHAGVEFFFVLSGFIIFYIHHKDLGKPSQFFSYASKRFMRIYPIYWLVLAGIVSVYFLVPSFGYPYHRQLDTIISSVLLVHVNGSENTELAVAWTLYHEILFYAFFALLIFNKRFGIIMMSAWMGASAATLVMKPDYYPIAFLFSPLQLLFGMGILACWITNNLPVPAPKLLVLLGFAIFMAAGIEEDYLVLLEEMPRDLVYGAGSTLILIGIVTLERRGQLKAPAPVLLMGNASYIIYLIHFTLLSFLAKIFIRLGTREALPAMASYALIVAMAVCLGIAAHLWIERPLLRFLKTRFRKQGNTHSTPAMEIRHLDQITT
jgi:peptidoglycan/LPS O-acetylase OafA/YrhL